MKRMVLAMVPFLLLAAAPGCTETDLILAKKTYRGPRLSSNEVAVISTRGSVKIAKIDGMDCFDPVFGRQSRTRAMKCQPSAQMMPGLHDIDLENASAPLAFGFTTPVGDASITLSVDAEAGHIYLARSSWLDEQAWFWIEDQASGDVIAGIRPPANARPPVNQ